MKQEAVVVKQLAEGQLLVRGERLEACGHNCQECSGCPSTVTLTPVLDTTGAKPGDRVLIELPGTTVLPRLAFVLFFPMVLGLVGYSLGHYLFTQRTTLLTILFVIFGFLCVWIREHYYAAPLVVRVVRKL
ncbi:MAG: SoxR reducing system RseC family protein [Limnochordia bacterium]